MAQIITEFALTIINFECNCGETHTLKPIQSLSHKDDLFQAYCRKEGKFITFGIHTLTDEEKAEKEEELKSQEDSEQ